MYNDVYVIVHVLYL